MSTDAKQLTVSEILDQLKVLYGFSEEHLEDWRNDVARDLNHLLDREIYMIETHYMASDWAESVLRIVERVAEFEEIEAKGKPNV